MDIVSYILSKSYVDKTLVGMGALKGSPAMISSIVDNPDGTHDITFSWKDNSDVTHTSILTVANGETPTITSTEIEGGHTITFATTNPSQSVSFNVMDGEEGQRGVSVIRADVDNNNYLTLELSDGNIINAGQIKTVSMVDNTLSLESANPVENRVITRKFGEYKTAFTGTEEEWNALTSEQQNVYDIMNITNDGDVLNLGIYLEKKTAMPVASEDVANRIYLYTGTTTQDYKKGVVYQCVSDGQDPATYSWVALIDFGTASIKNSTDRVSPNNTDLVESQSVYSAINTALSSIYVPRDDITCAELTSALLISDNIGNVYETSDSGTTTALFLQGAGHPIATGSNVGIINAGQGRILFNLMANAFDLTSYQKIDLTSAVEGETTVEGALGALSINKQAKTLSASVESQTTVEGALGALSTNKAAVEEVNSLKETLTNFEESITGEVVDSEPYVLRQGLGNLADMNLVGGSIAWNQLISNGNFASTSGWTYSGGVFSVANNKGIFTPSAQYGGISQKVNANPLRVCLAIATAKSYSNSGTRFIKREEDANGQTLSADIIKTLSTTKATYSVLFKSQSNCAKINLIAQDTNSSGWGNIELENFNLIDLTQMFGSTIADYIYSLEQATAEAGVAWFRKYFPNAYYGYQSGKIESVNPSSRKVVGKNFIKELLQGSIDTYGNRNATSPNRICIDEYIKVFPNTSYRLSASSANIQACLLMFDSIGNECNNIPRWTSLPYTFPMNSETHYCKIMFRYSNDSAIAPTDINVQFGTIASEYAFDPSIQLRGIPKLVDNKLSYDGDIYTADGTVTRKYGIVDMGTLTYSYSSSSQRMLSTSIQSLIKKTPDNVTKANIVCSKYINDTADNTSNHVNNNAIAIDNTGGICIYDSAYSDAAAFKTAMSGVYLVYELATPTTESAAAYQNPQRAFTDGTEEFIDAGVTGATRDVSIPVGNNTTYQLNETLPPTEDYVDGAVQFRAAISALGDDESGKTTASRAYTAGEFFYKDGKMYKVLTSIAQGATFTINTNCQQTTLFAELKALAQ